MTTTPESTVVTELARAIESRDAGAIITHYTEDATLIVLDRDHPPSSPQILAGRDAIETYYREVCGHNIAHEVHDLVSSPEGLAYSQHCRYPDGIRVVCVTTATLEEGLIARQTAVQCWDEP